MSILESCFLGFLQGLTEFLPISSSGHLVLTETLLQYKASDLLVFDLILHMATLLAVFFFYRQRLLELTYACLPPYHPAYSTPKTISDRKLIVAIGISTFVTSVIGLLFNDHFKQVWDNLGVVGISFLITGIFLIATLWARPKTSDKDTHYPINIWLFAVIMGLMQAISILPAISRSGATVCTALLLGLSRSRSVEYSFLMSIPVIILATIYESIFSDVPLGIVSFFPALFGFITSLVSGIIFLWLLVWITRRGQLHYFAFYTIPLGLLVLGYYFWIQ